jgi:hypothetical protein
MTHTALSQGARTQVGFACQGPQVPPLLRSYGSAKLKYLGVVSKRRASYSARITSADQVRTSNGVDIQHR